MTGEEIKKECEENYQKIKKSQERLSELRDICKHEKTELGNYSWRVGTYHLADICIYCGKPIKFSPQFIS